MYLLCLKSSSGSIHIFSLQRPGTTVVRESPACSQGERLDVDGVFLVGGACLVNPLVY